MKLDTSKIDNVKWEGIDHADYPDYCDAYIASADYDNRTMTDEELDELNMNYDYATWRREELEEHLY